MASAQNPGESPRGAQAGAPNAAQSAHPRFSYGRDWRGCGPADHPESGITLTTVETKCTKKIEGPTRPYIGVNYQSGAAATVKIVWGSGTQTASVVRCLVGKEQCDAATAGTINFDHRDSKNRPLPSYELQFADGSVEKGTFTREMDCHPEIQCW